MTLSMAFLQNTLLGLLLTVLAYLLGHKIYLLSGRNTLLQPVLVAIVLVLATIILFNIPYADYYQGAKPLTLLLGPVTIAMAVPLYQNLQRIRRLFWPVVFTVLSCATLTVVITLLIAALLGVSKTTLLSLATKSISTPIAIMVAENIGGNASLAAVFVMFTGILGAIIGPALLQKINVTDHGVKGITIGLTSHAAGTAIAFEISDECGAFSALAMGMTGILTALLLPLLVSFFTYIL